jgi:hypothetical protein
VELDGLTGITEFSSFVGVFAFTRSWGVGDARGVARCIRFLSLGDALATIRSALGRTVGDRFAGMLVSAGFVTGLETGLGTGTGVGVEWVSK